MTARKSRKTHVDSDNDKIDLQKICDENTYCLFPCHKVIWTTVGKSNKYEPVPFKGMFVGPESTFDNGHEDE